MNSSDTVSRLGSTALGRLLEEALGPLTPQAVIPHSGALRRPNQKQSSSVWRKKYS